MEMRSFGRKDTSEESEISDCWIPLIARNLRDNEFIHRHYRAEWPLKQVFSIFRIHDDTVNCLDVRHLRGFFLILYLPIHTAMRIPDSVNLKSIQNLLDMLQRTDFRGIRLDLLNCLPSLSKTPDLQKLGSQFESIFAFNRFSCITFRSEYLATSHQLLARAIHPDISDVIMFW